LKSQQDQSKVNKILSDLVTENLALKRKTE